jgi:histone H3/H4
MKIKIEVKKQKFSEIPGTELTAYLRNLRAIVKIGKLPYSEAERLAEPYLVELNKRMEKIAKKHNRKFIKAVFANF